MPEIINVPLKVTLVAETYSMGSAIADIYHANDGVERRRDFGIEDSASLPVVELAGRGCYEAYKRTNEKTDSHEGYMLNMLKQKHFSVLEHAVASLHIEGISRAESHELVRHRLFSFSQQSQRFCVVNKPYKVALHPTLLKHYSEEELLNNLKPDFELADRVYKELRSAGLDKKPAAEAARAYLPNAAATHLVMTGNLRNWIEFISKRDHEAADRGIQRLAEEIYRLLKEILPEVFGDEARAIWDEEFAQGKARHEAK